MGYEFTSRIRYSETDQHERLTIDHLADYYQDCTIFHDQDVGLGTDYWRERRAMWVLTAWKILIFDRPRCCQPVATRTDAINCKGFRGLRNFTMRDDEGRLLSAAFSKWALVSLDDGHPTRILPEEGEAYGVTKPLPIEEERDHIEIPEDAVQQEPIEVQPHHLDTNHHVNNAQYILLALSRIPDTFEVRTMRVSYHRSAALGDILHPRFFVGEHEIRGEFASAKGEPYAVFQFSDTMSEADRQVAGL